MNDMTQLDRRRSVSRITEEERALIDAAVAAGRVQHIPTGASAFRQDYVWKPSRSGSMRLVVLDPTGEQTPYSIHTFPAILYPSCIDLN